MRKGIKIKDANWHRKHLLKLKKRETIRRTNLLAANLPKTEIKPKPKLKPKPISRPRPNFWEKIKMIFRAFLEKFK